LFAAPPSAPLSNGADEFHRGQLQFASPAFAFAETQRPVQALASKRMELEMDQDTKHEIVVLTLGTLAALPVVTGIGLAIVAGVLAW